MEFLKKTCWQEWYPYQSFGSPLNLKYGESPNTNEGTSAKNTILQPFYLLDFKNRYASANINMESSKIIVNILLKLIC